MNPRALLNTLSTRCHTLPVMILYVTEGCNLQCVMCSYRSALPGELTLPEITSLAGQAKAAGLRRIVYSGGEPLLRRDFDSICAVFRSPGVKQTLLTNGLLLEKRFAELQPFLSEIIVSLDGHTASLHNSLRGLAAFDQIVRGIECALRQPGRPKVTLRTVIQRGNFRHLAGMVDLAKGIGVDGVSFLAADVLPGSFGRAGRHVNEGAICLNEEEVREFRSIVDGVASRYAADFARGLVATPVRKLEQIVGYYEALIGAAPYPVTICNAPDVSTVVTSTGEVLPCYFLPSLGNIRRAPLRVILNSLPARETRQGVRKKTVDRCRTCVCTLTLPPHAALADRF